MSIFCVAFGAFFYFAFAEGVSGLDVGTVGVILMIVGGLGLVVSDVVLAKACRAGVGRTTVVRETRCARAGTTVLQDSEGLDIH